MAVGRDLVDPSGELLITPVFRDQYSDAVLGRPAALGALDPHDAAVAKGQEDHRCVLMARGGLDQPLNFALG